MKKSKLHAKSKSTRYNRNLPILVAAIVLFFFGVAIAMYTPLNSTPAYQDLQEKNVQVGSLSVIRSRKFSDQIILRTKDGTKYYVVGKFQLSELQEQLKKGVPVGIKYYKRNALYINPIWCVQEITMKGKPLCTYQNYDRGNTVGCGITGVLMVGISILLFWGWKRNSHK